MKGLTLGGEEGVKCVAWVCSNCGRGLTGGGDRCCVSMYKRHRSVSSPLTARGALCLHTELHVPAVLRMITCTRRTSRPPGTRIGSSAIRRDSVYPPRAPQWRARVMHIKGRLNTATWHLRAALWTYFVYSADLKWLIHYVVGVCVTGSMGNILMENSGSNKYLM